MQIWEKAARVRALTGRSVLSLSQDLGLGQSAVGEWMKGHPARLSAERVAIVLSALGLDLAGRLRPDVVHRWEVRDGDGLDALREELAAEGAGWEMVPLAFAGAITLPPVPMYALRHGSIRVLLKYRPRLGLASANAFPTPERLQGLVSYAPGVDQRNPRRIDDALGRAWWDGKQVDMEMVDSLFGSSPPPPTWEDVRRAADMAGLGPADLLQFCSTQMQNKR